MAPRLAAAVLIAILPAALHAQIDSTRLVGRVSGPGGREPVAGVSVHVQQLVVVTDRRGNFRFAAVPAGRQLVRFELIGYQTREDSITIVEGETTELEIRLSQKPVELPPIAVTVRSRWLSENGFYERVSEGGTSGRFLTRAEIDRRAPPAFTDLFHDMPGAKVHRLGLGKTVIRFNRMAPGELNRPMRGPPGCQPMLYIDGRPHHDRIEDTRRVVDDFNVLNPSVIEAIEVYVGNTPIEFRGEGCGAILVWTRRGG